MQEIAMRVPGTLNRELRETAKARGAMLVGIVLRSRAGRLLGLRAEDGRLDDDGRASRRGVDPRRMATLDLHRIKARDGLELPVWVTKPRGREGRRGRRWCSCTADRGCAECTGDWDRGGAVSRVARLRRHRARVPRQHRLRLRRTSRRLEEAGARRCRTTSPTPCAGRSSRARRRQAGCIAGASYGGYATLMGADPLSRPVSMRRRLGRRQRPAPDVRGELAERHRPGSARLLDAR